jgi:hypothetical protein
MPTTKHFCHTVERYFRRAVTGGPPHNLISPMTMPAQRKPDHARGFRMHAVSSGNLLHLPARFPSQIKFAPVSCLSLYRAGRCGLLPRVGGAASIRDALKAAMSAQGPAQRPE